MATSPGDQEELLRQIWQTERFLEKESHNVHVSHRAWKLLTASAEQDGVNIGPFLETLARQLGDKLPAAKRDAAISEAEEITRKRTEQALELRERAGIGPDEPVQPPKPRKKAAASEE